MRRKTKATAGAESREIVVPSMPIRSETVLSRLPVHNLSKSGPIEIAISRTNEKGSVSLLWEVSPNKRMGQPGQMAYKLDTLVVNRRIDANRDLTQRDGEAPVLPKQLRLGSLSEIVAELGLTKTGPNKALVKRALQQNAATFIRAQLSYKTTDGSERWLDAFFNRYNVVFTGEKLANGEIADSVYLVLSETYWDVLCSAPFRPLDYDYLRELPPAPQRFYEVVSYRMYAALQNGYPHARMAYSEYCMLSAQARYTDYNAFKKQMWRVHAPHIESGYLGSVAYEKTTDENENADWMMVYEPGPRAVAEFRAFTRKHPALGAVGPTKTPKKQQGGSKRQETALTDGAARLLDAIVALGVSPDWARAFVRRLDEPGVERAEDVIDYWSNINDRRRLENPAGMLRRLLELELADGLRIPASHKGVKGRAEEARNTRVQEEAVNDEARRYLEEQRALDAAIDRTLIDLAPLERIELEHEAEALCAATAGFGSWAPNARERERTRQLRRLVAKRI